jgi:hypothetical protein
MQKVIGFRYVTYQCPWCDKHFGYNACKPLDSLPASGMWHDHVKKKHEKEYKKILELQVGERGINLNLHMDLMRGILPEERKRRTIKDLEESIHKKESELKDLKDNLKKVKTK